jgi:hypothetical protein
VTLSDGRALRARAVVNAAGPWVAQALAATHAKPQGGVRLIRGSHIVVPRLYTGEQAYILQNDDRRVVFVIPYEQDFSLIGTTEVPQASDAATASCTPEEAAYLCAAVSRQFRLPVSPADMMLRMVSQVVDVYLDLRRELTRQLDHWQAELINPDTRFNNWSALLEARLSLHHLDEICEDQRSAMQDWLESLNTWTPPTSNALIKEHEILKVRSRDVLEHIDRVVHHVRRLEQSIETAVQIHFNAQSNRTNETMRTLTSITAIFLPLNLIAAIFGMNFDVIPLLHNHTGFWWTLGSMTLIAFTLAWLFWRKRYLMRSGK